MTQDALFDVDGRDPKPAPRGRPRTPPADPFAAAVPGWLVAVLDVVNPAGRSASAKLIPCPSCGVPVLAGPNVQESGVEDLVADPRILSAEAQLAVLLAGRDVVEVEPRNGGPPRLFRRDRWLMGSTRKRPRFAAPSHACHDTPGVPAPWSMLYPNVPNHDESENRYVDPPF